MIVNPTSNSSKPGLVERIGSISVMALCALMVTGTICGLAVYSFVENVNTETANQYHNALLIAAGAVLGAVGKFWGSKDE